MSFNRLSFAAPSSSIHSITYHFKMRLILVLMILPCLAWAADNNRVGPTRNDKVSVITAESTVPATQQQQFKPFDVNDYYRGVESSAQAPPSNQQAPDNSQMNQQQPGPQGPNFMFNTGFHKGLGFSVPSSVDFVSEIGAGASASGGLWPHLLPQSSPPSHHQVQQAHSPLGELMATKADMMPAIFKTGFVITGVLAVLKCAAAFIHMIVGAKHAKMSALHKGGSAIASLLGADEPTATTPKDSTKSTTKASRKRRHLASPVFETNNIPGSGIDFEGILAQLDSIIGRFTHHLQQQQDPSAPANS